MIKYSTALGEEGYSKNTSPIYHSFQQNAYLPVYKIRNPTLTPQIKSSLMMKNAHLCWETGHLTTLFKSHFLIYSTHNALLFISWVGLVLHKIFHWDCNLTTLLALGCCISGIKRLLSDPQKTQLLAKYCTTLKYTCLDILWKLSSLKV